MARPANPSRRTVIHLAAALLLCLGLIRPGTARAETESPAPRAVAEIGGVGVVLIASEGKLHAFLDRLEDNAPVMDARLIVATAEGQPIAMTQASNGLFVAPFDPGSRLRDSFVVSVTSPDGTGDALAEIAYETQAAIAAPPPATTPSDKILIALVAGGIGLVLGSMAVRRRNHKRHELRPV